MNHIVLHVNPCDSRVLTCDSHVNISVLYNVTVCTTCEPHCDLFYMCFFRKGGIFSKLITALRLDF